MQKTQLITWHYKYVNGGDRINDGDEISLTPDDMNRWQILGTVSASTSVMDNYKWAGRRVDVPLCVINQRGTRGTSIPSLENNFYCQLPYVYDANIGYGSYNIFGNTPREVMNQVEEHFEKTVNIFKSLKP